MTILLYDYRDLEERASRHLNAWKAWHLILYTLAAIFGILNYVFLQNSMELVDNKCIIYPRKLEFRIIDIQYTPDFSSINLTKYNTQDEDVTKSFAQNSSVHIKTNDDRNETVKRSAISINVTTQNDTETGLIENDSYPINETHRLVLDTSRTLFGWDNGCQYAEYMPLMSIIIAAAWATFFTMCPGGGYSRSGLQKPWRILTPALFFAIVMVGLTGYSFTNTNEGLYSFCSAFYNVTNSTMCSAVNPFLERSWSTSWTFGERVAATRAASAGVWASWACAATLFLVRCLTAADFEVKKTAAYLRDPQQKITPHLKKPRRKRRVSHNPPTKHDNMSIRSEPTATTELVTASLEQDQDTAPTSPQMTPIKLGNNEEIEMTIAPVIRC